MKVYVGLDYDIVAMETRTERGFTVKYGLYVNMRQGKGLLISQVSREGKPDFSLQVLVFGG